MAACRWMPRRMRFSALLLWPVADAIYLFACWSRRLMPAPTAAWNRDSIDTGSWRGTPVHLAPTFPALRPTVATTTVALQCRAARRRGPGPSAGSRGRSLSRPPCAAHPACGSGTAWPPDAGHPSCSAIALASPSSPGRLRGPPNRRSTTGGRPRRTPPERPAAGRAPAPLAQAREHGQGHGR